MFKLPLAALITLLAACTPPPAPARSCAGTGAEPAVTVQLFFGRNIKGGGGVSDADWKIFLAEAVTPRFPAGLTVLEASGQWRQRSTGRIISERSTVVEIVTDAAPETIAKFDAIRTDYKLRFHQESVGFVVNESCASF